MNERLVAIAQELLEIANSEITQIKKQKRGRPKGSKNKKKWRMSPKGKANISRAMKKLWRNKNKGEK